MSGFAGIQKAALEFERIVLKRKSWRTRKT